MKTCLNKAEWTGLLVIFTDKWRVKLNLKDQVKLVELKLIGCNSWSEPQRRELRAFKLKI